MPPYYDEYTEALQDRITHLEKENDTLYKVVTFMVGALICMASFTIFILVIVTGKHSSYRDWETQFIS